MHKAHAPASKHMVPNSPKLPKESGSLGKLGHASCPLCTDLKPTVPGPSSHVPCERTSASQTDQSSSEWEALNLLDKHVAGSRGIPTDAA